MPRTLSEVAHHHHHCPFNNIDWTILLGVGKLHAEEGDKNKVLILPRIPMKHAMSDKFAFELTRLQFPIKIAFALTMNRAQGQSAEKCGILLPKHVWAHGQIYVAFS